MNHTSRDVSKLLNNLRKEEEDSLSSNSFVGAIASGYKYALVITSIVGMGMCCFLSVCIQDHAVGLIFGMIGAFALLLLPTYFSYRCYVDKITIKTKYYVLFVKVSKEVLWKDVEYKVVKRDSNEEAYAIRLYNSKKKRLISFDYGVVGFEKILKIAKSVPKLK